MQSPRYAGLTRHHVANATPMPTTAAVSATGSHDCAVLRSISDIISPTPSAGRQKAAGTKAELVACTLLAGRGRLRVPTRNICGCAVTRNAKPPFFRDLFRDWSQCGFQVTLRRPGQHTGISSRNGSHDGTFGFRALPLAQEAAPVGGNGSGSMVLVGPLLFVSKMRIPVTICFGTRLIRGR